ncbi:conserved protein of unknown function [Methylocella tundrae]|uniref:Uncharacterized protein n=2 Tax=Methylocella tundrae TaxID=227605 RepID=A0A4U8Z0Y5_METTU|nr:conserved protein of unknown function [Methylocella tundrae]
MRYRGVRGSTPYECESFDETVLRLPRMRQDENHWMGLEPARLQPARSSSILSGLMTLVICSAMIAHPAPAFAQSSTPAAGAPVQPAATPAQKTRIKTKNPTGSPLDTLMKTRLWADVPEAKDFVRQSRPPQDTLDYRPTTGTDPERPKPRTKAELDALQSELESALVHNGARGGQPKAARTPAASNPKQGARKTPAN